jgi:hypothetical protein
MVVIARVHRETVIFNVGCKDRKFSMSPDALARGVASFVMLWQWPKVGPQISTVSIMPNCHIFVVMVTMGETCDTGDFGAERCCVKSLLTTSCPMRKFEIL